eukprot:TRINITY_DN8599_c0_g1::TRINITY_DN8599_c0_g1_i1::g.8536::m.8536 TRINITY_DN8599_c0_g1::TRINITY_DN8599_c0_g1_i1::g.8536  ORF type:complete len:162 (-),score=2.99 TRINITY_DN8599_c0_g1_i1:58-480(-)
MVNERRRRAVNHKFRFEAIRRALLVPFIPEVGKPKLMKFGAEADADKKKKNDKKPPKDQPPKAGTPPASKQPSSPQKAADTKSKSVKIQSMTMSHSSRLLSRSSNLPALAFGLFSTFLNRYPYRFTGQNLFSQARRLAIA